MGKKEKAKKKVAPRPPVTPVDIVLTLVPVLFAGGLRTVAGPCVHEDGSAAMCTNAGRVLFGLGIVASLLVFCRLLAADLRTKRSFDLILFVAGIVIAVLPGTVLPLCMMATMRCHAIMLPFSRIMGGLLALGSVVAELTVDHEVPTGRKRR